jgi:excisionase family DNA binding protein
MAVESDVMTLHEAAEYLRVHPRTLRMKAGEGKIPGAKIGRVWRFHRRQLESWLLEGGVRSTAAAE